jgi:hypothetical protein
MDIRDSSASRPYREMCIALDPRSKRAARIEQKGTNAARDGDPALAGKAAPTPFPRRCDRLFCEQDSF